MKQLLKFCVGLALLAGIIFSANRLPALPDAIPDATASDPVRIPVATIPACKVDEWKYSEPHAGMTIIEGTTTCATGWINIRAFDDDKWLGNALGSIDGFTFRALLKASSPQRMSMKYTVEQR